MMNRARDALARGFLAASERVRTQWREVWRPTVEGLPGPAYKTVAVEVRVLGLADALQGLGERLATHAPPTSGEEPGGA